MRYFAISRHHLHWLYPWHNGWSKIVELTLQMWADISPQEHKYRREHIEKRPVICTWIEQFINSRWKVKSLLERRKSPAAFDLSLWGKWHLGLWSCVQELSDQQYKWNFQCSSSCYILRSGSTSCVVYVSFACRDVEAVTAVCTYSHHQPPCSDTATAHMIFLNQRCL